MSGQAPLLDAETRTTAAVALLAKATTPQEHAAVQRVALQARFLWHCFPCRKTQYLTTETCGCGAKRPPGLA
ncbi:hypothetical protein ACFWVB_02605 [Streptomyces microflavus]|uniref:hypothetical protein n=1 Tax=Streptomyces microflavus TaxID=1919 RepID=UPI0036463A7B